MSSAKVRKFKRIIPSTVTWVANVATVTTVAGVTHGLVAGDMVTVSFQDSPQNMILTVLAGGLTSTAFTATLLAANNSQTWNAVAKALNLEIGWIGQTSTLPFRASFTLPGSDGRVPVVQRNVNAAGTATYVIQGSLDNINWTDIIASAAHVGATAVPKANAIPVAYPYVSVYVTAFTGAGGKLEILHSN